MTTYYRYDAIELNDKAKEEDLIKLMRVTIIPYFKGRYSKLTRVSVCTLSKQEFLKDSKKAGRYIWFNEWTGREDAVSHVSFKGASMSEKFEEETKEMLKKISDFGKRKIANIYVSVE